MLLESGLAFIEGLALIVSPCILPVLPLVLSTSIEGGRKRPFGIIVGFMLAFTLLALASRALIGTLGINPDAIKNTSLILLAGFGLILLSTRLSNWFSARTQALANLGTTLSTGAKEGFGSGLLIGSLIGLIWAPCAGPILAAVLVQIIRQQSSIDSLPILLAFSLGAGLPMLLIALMGRRIIGRVSFFTHHAEVVRKVFGGIILLSVAFIASGTDAQSLLLPSQTTAESTTGSALSNGLSNPYPAPDFVGLDGWLNSPPLKIADLKGKVVLVDFWTYSCINCVRTLPYITAWDRKYRDQGLVIVGVHAPEFEFEKSVPNIRNAIAQHHIEYPVAIDSELNTWVNYHNNYWPAHYLIDRNGIVVYTHFGEGDYDVTENNIRYLLGLKTPATDVGKDLSAESSFGQTPETYLGYARADRYHGEPAVVKDNAATYHLPQSLPENSWALGGSWHVAPEKITAATAGSTIELNFKARTVFLVLGTASGAPVTAHLLLNGAPVGGNAGKDAADGQVTVAHDTLYELIDQKQPANGLLQIAADAPGLEAYAFTFGN